MTAQLSDKHLNLEPSSFSAFIDMFFFNERVFNNVGYTYYD